MRACTGAPLVHQFGRYRCGQRLFHDAVHQLRLPCCLVISSEHAHANTCTHTCTFVIQKHARICTCMRPRTHGHMGIRTYHVHMHRAGAHSTCKHSLTHSRTHAHTHAHSMQACTQAHTHARTHTCTHDRLHIRTLIHPRTRTRARTHALQPLSMTCAMFNSSACSSGSSSACTAALGLCFDSCKSRTMDGKL